MRCTAGAALQHGSAEGAARCRQVGARSHPLRQSCLGLHRLQGQPASSSSVTLRLARMLPCLPLHTVPEAAARGGASSGGGSCPLRGGSGPSGWGCTQSLDVGLLVAHLLPQGSILCLEALHLLPQVSDLQDGGQSSLGATAVEPFCASDEERTASAAPALLPPCLLTSYLLQGQSSASHSKAADATCSLLGAHVQELQTNMAGAQPPPLAAQPVRFLHQHPLRYGSSHASPGTQCSACLACQRVLRKCLRHGSGVCVLLHVAGQPGGLRPLRLQLLPQLLHCPLFSLQ